MCCRPRLSYLYAHIATLNFVLIPADGGSTPPGCLGISETLLLHRNARAPLAEDRGHYSQLDCW